VKKRAAIYCRVSTADQHPKTQLYDLREMTNQRGYEIVHEYTDTISGAKSKRPHHSWNARSIYDLCYVQR